MNIKISITYFLDFTLSQQRNIVNRKFSLFNVSKLINNNHNRNNLLNRRLISSNLNNKGKLQKPHCNIGTIGHVDHGKQH